MPCCARLRSKPSMAVWQRRDCPQDVHASTRGLSLPCPCQHKGTMPRISLLAQLEMHCREMPLGRKILELPDWLGSEQPRRGQKRTICTYWGFLFTKTFSFHLLPVSLRSRGSGAAQPAPGDTVALWGCSTRHILVPGVMPLTQNLWRYFVRGHKAEHPTDIQAMGVRGDRTPRSDSCAGRGCASPGHCH